MRLQENFYPSLQTQGYAFLPQASFDVSEQQKAVTTFRGAYDDMPTDPHLNKGEGGRFRRYARFAIEPKTLELSVFPHDRFFQSKEYDVLYGDIHRGFAPLSPETIANVFFQDLLRQDFIQFGGLTTIAETFEISVHMIRIAATPDSNTGRPAPEGIHRDGYHFGGIHLMTRHNIKGAENRIYDLEKQIIDRYHLLNPLDSILFDDRKIFHAVEPFVADRDGETAYRDMLILLYQPLAESPQRKAAALRVS